MKKKETKSSSSSSLSLSPLSLSSSSIALTVKVIEGRGLAAKDPNGRSDPYCLIGLPSLSISDNQFLDLSKCIRSETQFWNLSPTWKKAIFTSSDDTIQWVRIELWDKDYGKNDDFMGYAIIEIEKNKEIDKWIPLRARSQEDGDVTGDIHVLICHKSNQKEQKLEEVMDKEKKDTKGVTNEKIESNKEEEGMLKVRMLSVSGVPAIDDTNSSDPYCIIGLTDGSCKWIGESKRTKVVCSTCNPSWDEDALFEYNIGALSNETYLMIELWDKANEENADVLIGKVLMPLEDIKKSKHTTLYKPQLDFDPKIKVQQVTLLNFSCLYVPSNSVLEEDEWMLPRHERPVYKAIMKNAEQLLLSKQSQSNVIDNVYSEVLKGQLKEGIQSRLVRVFVSSTFTDTEKERNLLMEDVYPFMQRLCKVLGMEFETVDMRWGVRQETTLSHNTSNLCMSEIEKCVKKSFGPAFLCILGDKYGYRPFPAQILKGTFDDMWTILCEERIAQLKANNSPYEDVAEMMALGIEGTRNCEPEKWKAQTPLAYIPMCFKLDHNMKQPHYVLESRYDIGLADDKLWWPIFEDLQKTLRRTAKVISNREQGKSADDKTQMQGEWRTFEISVTEEEVLNGILRNKKLSDQSICVLRKIKDVEILDNSVRKNYIDVAGPSIDTEAVHLLGLLKDNVRSVFEKSGKEENIIDIEITQNELNPTKDLSEIGIKYRKALCDTICNKLASKLVNQYESQVKIASPLFDEVVRHLSFMAEKLEIYVERPEFHQKIIDYLTTEQPKVQTLVIQAPSGAGKTALMAWAAKWASTNISSALVITRFLGTSPSSSDVLSLLKSLCNHLIELLKLEGSKGDEDWVVEGKSVMQLSGLLQLLMKEFKSTNKLLVIVLDSLDQLLPAYGAHMLHWLPLLLPSHVRIVVSVLILPSSSTGSLDSSMNLSSQLHLLSTGALNEFTIRDMGINIAEEVMNQTLGSKQRTLTDKQKEIVFSAFRITPMPLYLQVAFTIAQNWHSYTPLESCILDEGMRGIINQVFAKLEKKHGETLITKALSYLIESRNGLSSTEMENILSCDEEVLSDIFEWWTPPVRRLPPLLWKRILEDLGKFVVERGIHGVTVHSLYHRQFREAAKARYVATAKQEQQVAAHLAKFFNGDFSTPRLVPFVNKKAGGSVQAEDRLIEPQPLKYSGVQFNRRKLSELPYLQTKSGDFFASLSSSLFNFEFIETKAEAGMLDELEEDYETTRQAITKIKENEDNTNKANGGKSIESFEALLDQFSRFIRNKRHVIRKSPKDTLMHALNGPNVLEITTMAIEQWKKNAVHAQKVIYKCTNKSPSQDPCTMTLIESGYNGGVDSICITKDFSVLIAGTYDSLIKLWNMSNGQEILTLSGHSKSIFSCVLTPDDSKLISAGSDYTIRIWDRNTGHQLSVLQHDNIIRSLAITRDGSKLICGIAPNNVVIYNTASYQIDLTFKTEAHLGDCALSPNDQLVAFVDQYGDTIFIFELSSGKLIHKLGKKKAKGCVFNSNSTLIFGDGILLKIWDLAADKFHIFGEHRQNISACAVSGNTVVSGSDDGVIVVWDLATGRNICSMRGHSSFIFRILTDGKKIVSGSQDSVIKVWDIPTAIKQLYSPHNGKVILCKPVKRNNKTMAVMCAEGDFFTAWDIESGNRVHQFRNIVGFVPAVSNDGRLLAVIVPQPQEHIAVWDLASERIIKTFPHDLEIISVNFSPSGSRIVTLWGNYPSTVTVWDVINGTQISTFDIGDEARVEFLDEDRLIYYQLVTQCNGDTASTASIIDVTTTNTLHSFPFFMDISLVTQVQDSVIAVATDIQVKVWDSATQQVLYEQSTNRQYNYETAMVLTDRALWISEKFGIVRMVDVKKWKEKDRAVVVDGEISQMFGIENKLVVCCKSGDVNFIEVNNFN